MKIFELEINKIRGIKNLKLHPNGKNIVVWGPNGTGKSGVIDSIDFLLTGQVTRLTGTGTRDLSLKKHGPHIDEDIKDAYVTAKVKLPGIPEMIDIRRDMSKPNVVQVEEKYREKFNSVFEIAGRGQHVLTRREILHYVTSEPGTRAEEIQILLNIHEIEKIRKNLVKVSGKATKAVQSFFVALEQTKSGVNATTQERTYDEVSIIGFINQFRRVLGGVEIETLDIAEFKKDILAPKVVGSANENISLIERDINNIQQIFSNDRQILVELKLSEIAILTNKLISKPNFKSILQRKNLYEIGINTLREEELSNCPLCDLDWEEGELEKHILYKISEIEEIGKIQNVIDKNSRELSNEFNVLNSSLLRVDNLLKTVPDLHKESKIVSLFLEKSSLFATKTQNIFENLDFFTSFEGVNNAIGKPENFEDILKLILIQLKEKFPKTTPEQDAWDTLTKLEENLKAVVSTQKKYDDSRLFEKRASAIQNKFEESRDKILLELYGKIQNRFVDLYKQLHGEDENDFFAKLEPKGASLNFEVNFYGRGPHPPHALHSEGHQDSMGLCLFLALSEFLASGIVDVILLDDVVMSVDSEHRRSLCGVLSTAFPDKQFVITTHDQTWANQLKTEGIVNSKTSIEFYNWSLSTGPHVNFEPDLWANIDELIASNDIPGAAAKLRRGSESFFESLCDNLEASVIYRQSHRWELGVFMQAAQGRYKDILKKAKESANSWGQKENVAKFADLDSTANQVFDRTKMEQWGVNSSVHYNAWANLTKNDFIPIKETFEDLFNVFICQSCKSMIKVVSKDFVAEMVKCNCGEINWNLKNKK